MSKPQSNHFKNTSGDRGRLLIDELIYGRDDETTAAVWKHIKATAENYGNTKIPRSFEIDVPATKETPRGKMWTHGNATEHMYEALLSIKDNPRLKGSNPNLYAQFILYDYYKALGTAVVRGIDFGKTTVVGSWEFAFSRPRPSGKYPVVKHALFRGIQKGGAR